MYQNDRSMWVEESFGSQVTQPLLEAGSIEQVFRTSSSHILSISVGADFTTLGVPAANHPVALHWTWFSTSFFQNSKKLNISQCPRRGLTDTAGLGRIVLLDMLADVLQLGFPNSCSIYCPPGLTGPFMQRFFLTQSVPGSALLLDQDVAFAFIRLHDFLQLFKAS